MIDIHELKTIVNRLESSYNRVCDSEQAVADTLVLFGKELDNWLVSSVRSLDGDCAMVYNTNEFALESALFDILAMPDDGFMEIE